MTKAIFLPDDYRKPAELLHDVNHTPASFFQEKGLLIPLHRDDITPRSTRASRNQGR